VTDGGGHPYHFCWRKDGERKRREGERKQEGKGKGNREGGERGVDKEEDSTTRRPVTTTGWEEPWFGTKPGTLPCVTVRAKHGKGEVHGRTDTFLDEKLEVRPFLMQVFGPHVDPFLDIQVPKLDAPFVYVTPTATTPWQKKPRTLDHAAFLPTLAGETDNYGVTYPIS
jgi:hypothetical protein